MAAHHSMDMAKKKGGAGGEPKRNTTNIYISSKLNKTSSILNYFTF